MCRIWLKTSRWQPQWFNWSTAIFLCIKHIKNQVQLSLHYHGCHLDFFNYIPKTFKAIFFCLSSKTFQDKICSKAAFLPIFKKGKIKKSWQVGGFVDLFWDLERNNQAAKSKPVGSVKILCTDFYNKVCQNVRTYQ